MYGTIYRVFLDQLQRLRPVEHARKRFTADGLCLFWNQHRQEPFNVQLVDFQPDELLPWPLNFTGHARTRLGPPIRSRASEPLVVHWGRLRWRD